MLRPLKPTIGQLIKKNREKMKMTQSELGGALGYRYGNFIGYLENGKAVFPIEKWEEYAEVLQIPKHIFLKTLIAERFPSMMDYLVFQEKIDEELDDSSSLNV